MSTLKLALVSVSAALLICLGLFSTASADRHATPTVSAAASLTLQSNAVASSGPSTAACPTNTVYTCCRCGGCGCRPRNISPTNWCAC